MSSEILADLLDRNARHTDSLPSGYFDNVLEGQSPPLVSLCCSDSRIPQAEMWDADEPGYIFTPSSIGNVAWEARGGERIVDGSLLYPLAHTETETVAVVGHTGCGAVTAAYRSVVDGVAVTPEPVRERVERLVPVVEEALETGVVDENTDDAVDALVEYNVGEQVDFLLESDDVPDATNVYGFVYDIHATYGGARGRTYLVNVDGETDTDAIRAQLPNGYEHFVRSLLDE